MSTSSSHKSTLTLCRVFVALSIAWSGCASAAGGEVFQIIGGNLQKRLNGVVGLIGYAVVPDVTTSSLSITNASSGNPGLYSTQFGGGATLSQSFPLYLEGVAAYTRYDPTFVASDGTESRLLPLRWNAVTASGGVGWDFPLTDKLVLRPILNIALGTVASDVTIAKWFLNDKLGTDFSFVDGGRLNAYGLGGSLMLDYANYTPEREIDAELRYSNINLQSFATSAAIAQGHATSESLGLWTRYRAPTGMTLMDRPVRYVLELAQTQFLGDLRGALGFNYLTSLGAGIEFDSSKYDVIVTRTRVVARYVFGNNVSGVSVGLAVSF